MDTETGWSDSEYLNLLRMFETAQFVTRHATYTYCVILEKLMGVWATEQNMHTYVQYAKRQAKEAATTSTTS